MKRGLTVDDPLPCDILHFTFQQAFPPSHRLALAIHTSHEQSQSAILSHLVCDASQVPRLLHQEQLTSTEMSVLLPLLEQFPYYCPNEVLYASFYNSGKANEERIEEAREHLKDAMEKGTWEQEMRAIRCAISRTRVKLRPFHIDISSILATGYILLVATKGPREQSEEEEER